MRTMKAARLFGPLDLRLMDVPVPYLRPHDVLCRVVRSGVCGTDYAIYTGEFSFVKSGAVRFPMTPGHEWSGTVAEIGPEVTRFRPGDRVVGDTGVTCGQCPECLVGSDGNCPHAQAVGTINAWDGAFAEYIVMPERHLFHLPETVGFEAGAMVEPAATALYAVAKAEVKPGDTVLVHGSGPIGLLAAKLAKLSGAAKVIITGRREFKLNLALSLGADAAINAAAEHLADAARKHAGANPIDKVIEASGSIDLLTQSLDLVKPNGIISAVAFYDQPVPAFDIDHLVASGITLRGVAGSLGMYQPTLKLMASGALDVAPLITARYPFSAVLGAVRSLGEDPERRIKVMLEM